MKFTHWHLHSPSPIFKQWTLLVRNKKESGLFPLVYFQRPKWIKDDACWKKIVESIHFNLPREFEIK